MDNLIHAYNIPHAFIDGLEQLTRYGAHISVRGKGTVELVGMYIDVTTPRERCLVLPGRNDSFPAKCAETLWMIQGRSDIGWLSRFLPRAGMFSDDGVSWRGAYGPRIRDWDWWEYDTDPYREGVGYLYRSVDQLKYVVDLLTSDPTSRQAVISIWNPAIDTKPGKDIPCNNWIQFLIRDNQLDMLVTQRSSDIWWGWSGIDAFSWTVLQQIIAGLLGVNVGKFRHFIGSYHLYDDYANKAAQLLKGWDESKCDLYCIMDSNDFLIDHTCPSLSALDEDLRLIMEVDKIYSLVWNNQSISLPAVQTATHYAWNGLNIVQSPMLRFMGQAIILHTLANKELVDANHPANPVITGLISDLMSTIPLTDFWVSMAEWLYRHCPSLDLKHSDYRWGIVKIFLGRG